MYITIYREYPNTNVWNNTVYICSFNGRLHFVYNYSIYIEYRSRLKNVSYFLTCSTAKPIYTDRD